MPDTIETEGVEIDKVFENTLKKISAVINNRDQTAFAEQDIVVDVELFFKSIYVAKSSGLAKLFHSQKHKEESLEIRIATRIRSS